MQLKIEKLIYGGEGLAHDAGTTLFVPFALPGEEVEASVAERKKNFVRGRLEKVLRASAERIEPRCEYFRDCGGCDYQHTGYESQVQFKEQILRETLRRVGHIAWQGPIAVHASPPWEYRNRAQWKVRTPSNGGATKNANAAAMGYFRARSSALCDVETCAILSPRLLSVLRGLRQALFEGALPGTLREVSAFADDSDRDVLLHLTCSSLPKAGGALAEELWRRIGGAKSILLQDASGERMELHGPGFLQYAAGGKTFRVGHLSFFQVNRFLVEEMSNAVAGMAGGGELAFDLFAGVGLFSAAIASNYTRVEAVEADPASARDLELNAASFGKSISPKNQLVEQFLSRWSAKKGQTAPDVAILDPPRAGLERAALEKLSAIAPRRIVYVSCDPATLARDLAVLCEKAYRAEEIHFFDMFPQTFHIETIVRLERCA